MTAKNFQEDPDATEVPVVVWDTPRVVIIAAHLLLGSWRILTDGKLDFLRLLLP